MKFSPMHLFDQLLLAGPTWIGVSVTVAAIVLVHVLRRFLPRGQRSRGNMTLLWFYLALALRLSAAVALRSGEYTVWVLLSFLDLISCALGIVGLVRLLVFDMGINRTRIRVPLIISDLLHLVVVTIVLLAILYQHGFDPLSLVTTSAVLTAVIGLALQGTIANVFAGLALHTDKTIGIGDWVQVGSLIGRIAEIKWRSTALWTEDGDLVIAPNSRLLDSEVKNLSRPDEAQRITVTVGFHYRHPPDEVQRVMVEAIRKVSGVRSDPAPDCVLRDFADSAITYAVRYWISDYTHHTKIESDVRTQMWYAARRTELEIPFPIRTLHLPRPQRALRCRHSETFHDRGHLYTQQ
jgi:small-conductance mechanosensitive channel